MEISIRGEKMSQFKDYAYYYDLFYKDKDYKYESELVIEQLKKNGINGESIISFGCGTGRHENCLAEMGLKIHGIDISKDMIEIANSVNIKGNMSFEVSDIRTYSSDIKYNAVISLFQVISYQITNDDILNTFSSARKLLKKGGIFLFDVWYGPGVLTSLPEVRIKRIHDDNGTRVYKIAEPIMHYDKNVVDVCYEVLVDDGINPVKSFEEKHVVRYYFRPEIECFLEKSGFKLIDNYSPIFGKSDSNCFTSYFIAIAK